MDFSEALIKIGEIQVKISEFKTNIEGTYNKYATKINTYIDELDSIMEKFIEAVENAMSSAVEWISMKLKKLTKKIQDTLDALTVKIDSIKQQVTTWCDKTVKQIKINAIKSAFAKIGQDCNDSMAESFADMIPGIDAGNLLPDIKINLQLPDLSNMNEPGFKLNKIELKKLPLL